MNATRRQFVRSAGLAAGLVAAPAFLRGPLGDAAETDSRLFPLGVASGDPGASSVVIWTRLAPYPLEGGGLGTRQVPVKWEVAADPGMSRIVTSGKLLAVAGDGHAVKVVVRGLTANRWYYYRFRALGESSRIGRTRTFPGFGTQANRLRFALASCQNYQAGFYSAYRDMAEQDLDCVVHVGDYIYEGGPTNESIDAQGKRVHNSPEIHSVADYRNRYALYKLDPHLKDAHARFPFIVTWDDHEVENNYAGDHPENNQPAEAFLARRAAAYQVYYETMPLRPAQRPKGPNMRLFRNIKFGDLAEFHVMDTRQFRTDQPCGDGFGSTDPRSRILEPIAGQRILCGPELTDPTATMAGPEQEAWLFDKLRASRGAWNILAQQVMMTRWNLGRSAGAAFQTPLENLYNVDAWDGYPAARKRLIDFLAQRRPRNPVVVTGDIHSAWAANLLENFENPASDAVAAEFVCTSISSNFGDALVDLVEASLPTNPHIRYFNGIYRGYSICDLTEERWVTEYRGVENVDDPSSSVSTTAVFRLRSGFNSADNGGEALEQI